MGKLLLAVVLLAAILSHNNCVVADDDFCDRKIARLQIVFVYDRSGTFDNHRAQFANVSGVLIEELQKEFPGSEFGMATFSDYEPISQPRGKSGKSPRASSKNVLSGPEDCYQPHLPLTQSVTAFKDAIRTIERRYGGDESPESSLPALTFAACDSRMGWSSQPKAPDGKFIHKILVLATDEESVTQLLKPNLPGPRSRPRLDGTDNCSTSLPPHIGEVETALLKNDMQVLGLFVTATGTGFDTKGYYDAEFGQIKRVRYKGFQLKLNELHELIEHLKDGIEHTFECVDPDPPPYNTLGY